MTLYFTYMKYLELANSYRQKAELTGVGGRGEWKLLLTGLEFVFGVMKKF